MKTEYNERSLELDADPQLVFGDEVNSDMMMVDLEVVRHFPGWSMQAVEDIQPDEELFDNYLVFGGFDFFQGNLRELKALCSGEQKFGIVSQYEIEKQ